MTVDFREIFRIGDDGIYFESGNFSFSSLAEKDGCHGEEEREEDCFSVKFYCKDGSSFKVVFLYSAFDGFVQKVGYARAKSGSFCFYLKEKGINIKLLEN